MSFLKVRYLRVTHPFAAILKPIAQLPEGRFTAGKKIARLACLIHAASVHSEPGSNPPKAKNYLTQIDLGIQRTIIIPYIRDEFYLYLLISRLTERLSKRCM